MAFDPVTYILCRTAATGAVEEAIAGLGDGMTFKGTVPTPADLPSTHNDGDMWIVDDLDPSTPGQQGGKAVWMNAQWNYFDQQPSSLSDLANDMQYISSKIDSGNYVDYIHIDGNRAATPTTGAHEYIIKDMQMKRGSATELASYVPKAGEPVFEKTGSTYRLKIGDGSSSYSSLPYIGADFTPDFDNKSVNIVGTNLQVFGFNTAGIGTIPRKTLAGNLEWIRLADVIDLVAGVATLVTKSSDVLGNVSYKLDVLIDNNTVKVNTLNRLYVPVDNDTIKATTNGLTAKKTVAGPGIKVTTNTNNEYVVAGDYKAGDNINIEQRADGLYINSTGGGGESLDNLLAGDGIKITPSGGNKIVSADYQAGDYININKVGGKLEISVDPTAVENTFRPIRLNDTEIAPGDPTSGYLNFESTEGISTGIKMQGITGIGSRSIRMEIANTGLLQAQEVNTPHRALANLTGRLIAFHCGNADFTGTLNH